ncbi:hypothetical protein [Aurantimonas coralicida]|uniref:hypothetical protein n=1 Tax=Aurantimonas coralicida TaxID=182270 RepID=UPI001E4F33F5|nr:hypothetical protein [Aurantimonas coralicida]MCD1645284.1 hypothetical protein [Aurantimonas coralicida]
MGIKHDAAGMTPLWCAVSVADAAFKDEELAGAGISFTGRERQEDGTELLGRLEALFHTRPAKKGKPDASDSLQAFLGSRGVKTSLLLTEDHFWTVAMAMWPAIERGQGSTLTDLTNKLRGMTKKQRKSARREAIPSEFRA